MKKTVALLLTLICLLPLFSCNKAKDGSDSTAPETVTPDTTVSDTTDPVTTEGETTPAETTTEGVTTEPYVPIYEDGGFTYEIDVRKYLQYIDPADDTEYLIIANRKHPLGKNYVPKNLTYVAEGQTWLLRRAAKEAFEAMRLEMQKLGVYDTYNRSTYRSYSFQNTLYYKYIDRDSKLYPHLSYEQIVALVDTYSARPGTSDHQTGLTIDFNPLNESFANLKAFKYMKDNAHKFGFILRYPKGKEYITGYKYEPWHWRFVGRDAATYIYEHGITLEEYMAEKKGTEVETFPATTKPPLDPPETLPDEIEPDITTEDVTTPDEVTTEEVITTEGETTTDESITTEGETTTDGITTDEVTTPVDTTTADEVTTTPEIATEEAMTTEEVTTEAVTTAEAEVTDAETTE